MTIEVAIRHRLGDFALDVAFSSEGGITALFGPSGSGKTSLVNQIAGLERPDHGRIVVDGRVLVDTAAGIFIERHRRGIGYVFQEGRLFPHMTVRGNLTYGRWLSPRSARKQSFSIIAELLGIEHLLERWPAHLSGGEMQRVAIGRALLASPRLLLMDEPLAALDDRRKAELLPYIERLGGELRMPIVYVSHSVAEVRRLASTLVVLAAGRVAAIGPAEDVMARLDLFPLAADTEAGTDIDALVESHDAAYGLTLLATSAGTFRVPRIDALAGTPVRIRVRAREVLISTQRPNGLSALNVIEARVEAILPRGAAGADVRLTCNGIEILARLTRQSVADLGLTTDLPVFAIVKSVSFEREFKALENRNKEL